MLGPDYEVVLVDENMVPDTCEVIKEFTGTSKNLGLSREEFELMIILLRQRLEYECIFDLLDCIAKDNCISMEEWESGISNLASL